VELTATSQYSRSMQLLLSSKAAPAPASARETSKEGDGEAGGLQSAAKEAKRTAVLIDKLHAALDEMKDARADRKKTDDKASATRKTDEALRKLQDVDGSGGSEDARRRWNSGEWHSGFGGSGRTIADFRLESSSSSSLSISSDNLNASFTTSRSISVGPDGISFSFSQTASAEFVTEDGLKVSIEMSRARQAYIGTGSGYVAGSGYDAAA
jgi:hypothetical protein